MAQGTTKGVPIDVDPLLAADSDLLVPSQKAIKSYVDTENSTKQDTITGAATTITSSNLTASRALVSDGSGKVAANAVTSTELGYLSGVTSSIQTQLNTKIGESSQVLTFQIASTINASTPVAPCFLIISKN